MIQTTSPPPPFPAFAQYRTQAHAHPAWPRDWDVEFKLHAPHRTTIEGIVEGGKLMELEVSPGSRTGNVVLGAGWTDPNPSWAGAEDER